MNRIEIEKIMREAKIIDWKENGVDLFQQNHIGIPNKTDKLENKFIPIELKLYQEG